MTARTTKGTFTFANPFTFNGFDEVFPAGAYNVETDEELVEGLSFDAYRRTLVFIHLPTKSGRPGHSRTLTIDPNELDMVLKRDATPAQQGMLEMKETTKESNNIPGGQEMLKYKIERVPVDYFCYQKFRYTNLEDAIAQAKRDEASREHAR